MWRAVLQAEDRQPPDGCIGIRRDEGVEQRAIGVDRRRAVPRQQLERQQRRAAGRWTLILEPTSQQLQLLPVPELSDRAIGDGALAKVGAPGRSLELVLPLRPQRGELALGARGGQLVGLGGG